MAARQSRSRFEPGAPARKAALRLEWPGRAWQPGAFAASDAYGAGPRIVTEEEAPLVHASSTEPCEGGARLARLVHGDALDTARALAAEGLVGKVDLVYIDPPFASQSEYVHEARLDGPADGRVVRTTAYDDRWEGGGVDGYLDMLAPRLDALAHLLAPAGTLWVHVDYRASYLVRVLLDEILGRDAFVNEIVWRRAPNLGRQAQSHQFGRTLDTLIVYGRNKDAARLSPPTRLERIDAKAIRWDAEGRPFTSAPRGDYTDESMARLDKEGRVHHTASGKSYVKYFLLKDEEGEWCRERRVDALWTDVSPLRHAPPAERTGFPTQKPRALLDRIVSCASSPGGLVVDLFAGSGTTGESAWALGRRFVLGDVSALAVATARSRLLRKGVPLAVQRSGASLPPSRAADVCAALEEHVAAAREGEKIRVSLREPVEPLAWAIDPAYDASRPFRPVWHSERIPGIRARAAERFALLEPTGGPLGVRVWYDDGQVGTRLLAAP